MQYNFRHNNWQLYVENLLKNTLIKLLYPRLTLTFNFLSLSKLSHLLFLISNRLSIVDFFSQSRYLPVNSILKSIKKSLTIVRLLFKPFLMSVSTLIIMNNAYALSATTSNTIIGTKPYLVFLDGETKVASISELMGFIMPKQDGSSGTEQIDLSMVNTILTAPKGMKFSDVILPVLADGELHNLENVEVADVDGDGDIKVNTNITGRMKATWYKRGVKVPASDLGETLTECGGDYSLYIEIPEDVVVSTKYGDPNTNPYGKYKRVMFTFAPAIKKICYLKPAVTYNNTSGTAKYPLGYNPKVWDAKVGFTVDSGFPSMIFQNATFMIIGSPISANRLNIYRCSSPDDGGKISLSSSHAWPNSSYEGLNCAIEIKSKKMSDYLAGGTPTISLEYNTGSEWVKVDTIHLPKPTKFAFFGLSKYCDTAKLSECTVFKALDYCRGVPEGTTTWQQGAGQNPEDREFRQKYLYRRNELTNSLRADPVLFPENVKESELSSDQLPDNFARDSDGTLFGEWGGLIGTGGFEQNYFWTAEATSDGYQYLIDSYGQPAGAHYTSTGKYVACRGDNL